MHATHNEPLVVLDDFAHDEQNDSADFDADRRDSAFAHLIDERDLDLVWVPSVRNNVCHWTTFCKENEALSTPDDSYTARMFSCALSPMFSS